MASSMPVTVTSDLPKDDIFYEVIDGQITELEPMGAFEIWLATELCGILRSFAKQHGLGRSVQEMLFDLTTTVGRKRRPDVAYVSYERWACERPIPRTEAWDVVPNLAVEIISATNLGDDVVDKVAEYFQAGVELAWVIVPSQCQVYAYTSPTDVRVLTGNDRLAADRLLPGFELPLSELFEEVQTKDP